MTMFDGKLERFIKIDRIVDIKTINMCSAQPAIAGKSPGHPVRSHLPEPEGIHLAVADVYMRFH